MILLDESQEPKGLDGLLILPVIVLIMFIIGMTITLVNDILPIFTNGYWKYLTSQEYDTFHELWAISIIYETIGSLILLSLAIKIIFSFRASYKHFPKLFLAYISLYFLYIIIAYNLSINIPAIENDPEIIEHFFRQMFFSLIVIIIWIPYMIKSRRVRNTFV